MSVLILLLLIFTRELVTQDVQPSKTAVSEAFASLGPSGGAPPPSSAGIHAGGPESVPQACAAHILYACPECDDTRDYSGEDGSDRIAFSSVDSSRQIKEGGFVKKTISIAGLHMVTCPSIGKPALRI